LLSIIMAAAKAMVKGSILVMDTIRPAIELLTEELSFPISLIKRIIDMTKRVERRPSPKTIREIATL